MERQIEKVYSRLTSQELNDELKTFLQILPFDAFAHEDVVDDTAENTFEQQILEMGTQVGIMERRSKSEAKQIILQNLRRLLNYCPSTEAFREYVIDMYSKTYDHGEEKEDPVEHFVLGC